MSNATAMLTIRNLGAWYGSDRNASAQGKRVLSGLSLDLNEHEVTGLIGLNGAGKTTFIRTVSGLHETFQAEEVCLRSSPVSFRDACFKRERYVVFAEDDSFRYFTFREYLTYVLAAYRKEQGGRRGGRKYAGMFRKETDREECAGTSSGNRDVEADAAALIRGFHFEAYTDTLIKDLSTGNRKKVFLITAFVLRPRLLLLDEPVNGLDFESTEFLYRLISEYKAYGTLLFSSHILESITMTCDRVMVLENGRIGRIFDREQMDDAALREALFLRQMCCG